MEQEQQEQERKVNLILAIAVSEDNSKNCIEDVNRTIKTQRIVAEALKASEGKLLLGGVYKENNKYALYAKNQIVETNLCIYAQIPYSEKIKLDFFLPSYKSREQMVILITTKKEIEKYFSSSVKKETSFGFIIESD